MTRPHVTQPPPVTTGTETHYSITGYDIVLFDREGTAITRLNVPDVVASELFEQARISAHADALDVFVEYLKSGESDK